MALQLPSVKPRAVPITSFDFIGENCGSRSVLEQTPTARAQIVPHHPLEHSLKNHEDHEEAFNRSALLHAQGPAGPMIRAMELRAANSIGRLPFLQSSNFQRDVLTGKDEEIDFDDVFGLVPRYKLAMEPSGEFRIFVRMSCADFEQLFQKFAPHIRKENTKCRDAIPTQS